VNPIHPVTLFLVGLSGMEVEVSREKRAVKTLGAFGCDHILMPVSIKTGPK
jgi:hypothetical protein